MPTARAANLVANSDNTAYEIESILGWFITRDIHDAMH